jgi:hypothetical protein
MIDNEALSIEDAQSQMTEPLSDQELGRHATKSSGIVTGMYAKTEHPLEPEPASNKAMAVSILKKIRNDLARNVREAELESS